LNWEAIGAGGEILGAIAVLVTLIYLARQVSHSTKQARLDAILAVNSSNDSAFEPVYIPENSVIFSKGQQSYSSLEAHEEIVFNMLMTRLIASFSATTYQYEQGSYDEGLYWGTASFYASFNASPGGAEWFMKSKNLFSKSAVEKLENIAEKSK
jgi:hypothetical protein